MNEWIWTWGLGAGAPEWEWQWDQLVHCGIYIYPNPSPTYKFIQNEFRPRSPMRSSHVNGWVHKGKRAEGWKWGREPRTFHGQ